MNGTNHKKAVKDYWNDPIMAAKRMAYKEIYIPENLRGKIKIYLKKNGAIVIKEMKKITGKKLIKLGFKRQDVSEEESGENAYHYYRYEISKKFLLISCSSDEKIDDGYLVEFYESYHPKIRNLKDLKKLIKILERAKND